MWLATSKEKGKESRQIVRKAGWRHNGMVSSVFAVRLLSHVSSESTLTTTNKREKKWESLYFLSKMKKRKKERKKKKRKKERKEGEISDIFGCNLLRKKKVKWKRKKEVVICGLPHQKRKEKKVDKLSGKQADVTTERFLQFLHLSA